jgi:hypothetical protein
VHLQAAGWEPTTWWLVLGTTALAAAGLAVTATRERSRAFATLTLATATIGTLSALLPAAPPNAVLVVLPAALVLLIQLAAWTAADHELWARPTAALAPVAEVASGLAIVPLSLLSLAAMHLGRGTDLVEAIALALLAAAWGLAAGRRRG